MKPLRILHVEDHEEDVLLVERDLRRNGYAVVWERVDTPEDLRSALARGPWDLVLSDYHMPAMSAEQALAVLKASDAADVPFIVVSGSIGEAAAVNILKQGAHDFVIKDNLARLAPAVARELDDLRVRRERREAQAALAEALASREEIIALAGHEFRNPLAALQITVDTLTRSGKAPELAASLTRQAGRLRDLVTRLVDVAAINAGTFSLRASQVDLVSLTRGVVRRIADGSDRIELRAPATLPVDADHARFELVVASLLENALKFAPEGPIEIELALAQDGSAELAVRDRGPGLAGVDRSRLRRPFLKGVSSRHYGGFGLGLWLSDIIVQAHEGELRIEERSGGGLAACVRLPLSRSAPGSSRAAPRD